MQTSRRLLLAECSLKVRHYFILAMCLTLVAPNQHLISGWGVPWVYRQLVTNEAADIFALAEEAQQILGIVPGDFTVIA